MKFTQQYSIKWHDTDANRQVRPSALVTYLQETANEHLIHIGISLDELRDRYGLAFILGSISVCSYEPLFAGDHIEVKTWTCGERGFRHNRCFRLLRDGKTVAEATSQWALIRLTDGSLVKVEDMPYHIEPEEPITLSGVPARLRMPPVAEMQEFGTRRIVYSDIDYNGHMNNTRYPDMLCDFIPEMRESRMTGMVLSYRKEAAFGHTLRVFGKKAEQGYLLCTVDKEGSVCTEAFVKLCAASNQN
jgi:acyl-CoA thioesterase FadM